MLARRLLALVAPPLCAGCGGVAPADQPLCERCRGALVWLGPERVGGAVETWAPLSYQGPVRDVVSAVKFRGLVGLVDFMAAQIAVAAPGGLLHAAHLVPVPLHPARLRRRGFNQAERLASALATRTGLPVLDCLERRGSSSPQVGRGRRERVAELDGTIALRRRAPVPRRALLVDDVITTGATLAACERALRRAGGESVRGLAYARTPGR